MKVIKSGKPWSERIKCTGHGNGGGGCKALLEVEASDLYLTHRSYYDGGHETFITFTCPECKFETDIDGIPLKIGESLKDKPKEQNALSK